MLSYIIIFSLLGSIFSTVGGLFLLWKEKFTKKISSFLISFAVGVLLAVAFLDVLPEAVEKLDRFEPLGFFILVTIVFLFIVERALWWYHHHRMETEEHPHKHVHENQAYLLLIGDSIHNFIDGVLIAAAFFSSFPLGVGVAIGVIAHEIPQEIADFAIMLGTGMKRAKVLILNFLSSLMTVLGALLAYFSLSGTEKFTPYTLAIAAGVFIYVALSDLIPIIHHQSEHKYDLIHFLLLFSGVALIFFL